jgi:single-strand DNA-binding protein
MHQINVSLVGVAVSEVRAATTESGHSMARFRLVCRPRRFDAATGTFIDHDPSYVTVLCWRQLAEHVTTSVRRGDQVLVTGRMRVREWEHEGRLRISVEVDAQSVGLDLNRAPANLQRHTAAAAAPPTSAAEGR